MSGRVIHCTIGITGVYSGNGSERTTKLNAGWIVYQSLGNIIVNNLFHWPDKSGEKAKP